MRYNPIFKVMSYFISLMVIFSTTASADEAAVLAKINDLSKQMMLMQKTIEKQNIRIDELEQNKEVVRNIAGPDQEGSQSFASNLKEKIGDSDAWLKDLDFSGDFRLRYEALDMVDSAGKTTTSGVRDRNRFRYRLRYGFTKKFHPDMEVGFRMVSSLPGGRTSTNTTLDTQFNYKGISIDRAYARYTPSWAKYGPLEKVDLWAGKFKNPIKHNASWILWDSDVTPEGAYQKFSFNLLDGDNFKAKADFIAGQWILEEGAALASHDDAELYLWSGDLRTEINGIMEKPIKTRHHVTFYDYKDFASRVGNFGAAGNNPVRDTGVLAAEDFDIWDFYNEIQIQPFDQLPAMTLFYDYVQNTNDRVCCDLLEPNQDKAWAIGAKIGKAKNKGTWEVGFTYAAIEANAVPSVFSDSDFGGTDERGSVIKLAYALTDDLVLSGKAFFTNNLSNPAATEDAERRLFQFDMVWTF